MMRNIQEEPDQGFNLSDKNKQKGLIFALSCIIGTHIFYVVMSALDMYGSSLYQIIDVLWAFVPLALTFSIKDAGLRRLFLILSLAYGAVRLFGQIV